MYIVSASNPLMLGGIYLFFCLVFFLVDIEFYTAEGIFILESEDVHIHLVGQYSFCLRFTPRILEDLDLHSALESLLFFFFSFSLEDFGRFVAGSVILEDVDRNTVREQTVGNLFLEETDPHSPGSLFFFCFFSLFFWSMSCHSTCWEYYFGGG